MVFSSIPVYLHAPNWQQQPIIQNVGEHYRIDNPHQLLHQPLPPEAHHVAGGVAGPCKPGSMSDRARQANIPQPEAGLKCPRCESTNTKFCYFNNYSLSQPRHFCKACRRYWTRGGALRNVPVGGGSRRNKKNKRSRSKSPVATDDRQAISNPDGENIVSRSYPSSLIMSQLPQPSQLPLMTSLQNINSRYGVGNVGAQIQIHADPSGFHMGNASSTVDQQWRFPFSLSTTFESPASIGTSYQFQSHHTVETPPALALVGDNPLGTLTSSSTVTTTRATTQLPPAKYEDHRAINLATSSLPSFPANGNQYWGIGNSWTDISALNSSSTGHLL